MMSVLGFFPFHSVPWYFCLLNLPQILSSGFSHGFPAPKSQLEQRDAWG